MIITKLIGGLGNQMFQYAAGLAMARRNDLPLRLDVSALRRYRKHQGYQFDTIFTGEFRTATTADLFRMLGLRMRAASRGKVEIAPWRHPHPDGRHLFQPTHDYWPGFAEAKGPCYLSGYWQSERYFDAVEREVREHFRFRDAPAGDCAHVAQAIGEGESVSIHIRRGDYVSDPAVRAFHGVCGWDYYDRAIARMAKDIPKARFFAFSDEPEVARRRFAGDDRIAVIDINRGRSNYLDMMLMSLCRNHIIANSTFSWWAAWLCDNADKRVIAPKNWFAGAADTIEDIYCQGWLRL